MLSPSFPKKNVYVFTITPSRSLRKGYGGWGPDFISSSLSLSCFLPPMTICLEALVPFACAALWVIFSMTWSCPLSTEIPWCHPWYPCVPQLPHMLLGQQLCQNKVGGDVGEPSQPHVPGVKDMPPRGSPHSQGKLVCRREAATLAHHLLKMAC